MRFRRHWCVELDPPLMTSQTQRLFSVCVWFWRYFCGWIIFCELVACFFQVHHLLPVATRPGMAKLYQGLWMGSKSCFWMTFSVGFSGWIKNKNSPQPRFLGYDYRFIEFVGIVFVVWNFGYSGTMCVMRPIPDCTSLNQKNEHRHSAAAFGQDSDRLSGLEKLDASFHYVSKSVILRIIQDRNG